MIPFLRIFLNPLAVFFKARQIQFHEPMLNPAPHPSPLETPPLETKEGRNFLKKLIKLHDQLSSPQRHRERREKMFVHPIGRRRLDERPIIGNGSVQKLHPGLCLEETEIFHLAVTPAKWK
jgi:hypothetical protein